MTPDEMIQILLKGKDDLIKAKDEAFDAVLKAKDAVLKEKDAVLKEKDERLKAKDAAFDALLKEKDERLKDKDEMLKKLQCDVLQAHGALTCRGVMEFIANCVLPHVQAEAGRQRTGYARILQLGAEKAYNTAKIVPMPSDLLILKEAYESHFTDPSVQNAAACGTFYNDLYGELSKNIHGAPWSGQAVKNTFPANDSTGKLQVIQYICKHRLGLEMEEAKDKAPTTEKDKGVGAAEETDKVEGLSTDKDKVEGPVADNEKVAGPVTDKRKDDGSKYGIKKHRKWQRKKKTNNPPGNRSRNEIIQ